VQWDWQQTHDFFRSLGYDNTQFHISVIPVVQWLVRWHGWVSDDGDGK
jgi:hypothetical protein